MKKILSFIFFSFFWCLPVSAYQIGDKVYLNACGADPQKYFDEPLNIQNIIIEVPNRVTYLEKSEYERDFQTIANSKISVDGKNIDISVSNFRDLMIRGNDGHVLAVRKITGASSLYEIKHKGEVVAWGVGWHKNCGNVFEHVDFTALRLFIPIIEKGKIKIQQKVVSLNLNKTYKTLIDTENLVLSEAIDLNGSSRANTYYYKGSFFYEINKEDGFKYFLDFEDLVKNINLNGLEPVQRIATLAKYNQVDLLEAYTKENFDLIYKDLQDNYWFSVHWEWMDERPKLKKIYELINNGQPFPVSEIELLKKSCFKRSEYKDLEDLVRNCFYWHSSLLITSLIDDFEWLRLQTDHKNSRELLINDKKNRFEKLIKANVSNLQVPWRDEEVKIAEELIESISKPAGDYKVLEDGRYLTLISGCMPKNCRQKGFVYIWLDDVVGLIRHWHSVPYSKEYIREESEDFLIFSNNHKNYDDLPSGFFAAVRAWAKENSYDYDTIKNPNVVRFIGSDNKLKIINMEVEVSDNADATPWLGVRMNIDDDIDGVRVVEVVYGSPSYNVGIKRDDRIVQMGSTPIIDNDDLIEFVKQTKIGEKIKIKIIRNNTLMEETLKMASKYYQKPSRKLVD